MAAMADAQAVAPQPAGGIFGRVVNAETREPVRRAAIKVYTSKAQWDAITDGEGRFKFPDLERAEYSLLAHRDGYTDRAYIVERSDFDEHKELPIELRPQGLITGRAVDEPGQALASVRIEALASRGGRSEVVGWAETNDLGEYRLSGLNPGTYQLRATYSEGGKSEFDSTPVTIASAYYGGRDKPAEITVKSGSVITGIDFTLNPVRPATVRGTLRTETGALTERATLWIMGKAGEGGGNSSSENGKFEIADVASGSYTISAETLDKTEPLFGITTVDVSGADVDAAEIVLRPIPKVEGEVRVEGGGPTDLRPASVYFMSKERVTALPMQIGQLDENRKFIVALIPGEYSLGFDDTISKLVRTVTLDGKPVTNWKIQVDASLEPKKLVIVVGTAPRP